MFKALFILCQLTFLNLCYFWILSNRASLAQVTPDASGINTQVNQDGGVAEITGGQTRGSNLFHSFQDFSVGTGNEAFFNNANDIANIFSRVTGGNISNIDGLIRANGSADLFLINPAGIIFSENARLDIGGSFYGSSANSILFEDGEFSAVDNLNEPILTINAPIGLGFRDNPGDIALTPGSELGISSTKTFALVGGNVSFDDGFVFPSDLTLPGFNLELGGLTEAGTVGITEDGSLSFPENVARGDVSLTKNSRIIFSSAGGGSLSINARNFEMNSNAQIISAVSSSPNSTSNQSGDIAINTTENVVIDGANSEIVFIGNSVFTPESGRAGNIEISGKNISLVNGGVISSNIANTTDGRSSDITLTAEENITLNGTGGSFPSSISNQIIPGAEGEAVEINLTSQNLTIEDGASIDSSTLGIGDSSDININASDTVIIDGTSSRLQSVVIGGSGRTEGAGNVGNINLQTTNLFVRNDGRIESSISGQGNGGDINITANDISVDGEGSLIFSGTSQNIDGEEVIRNTGGDITISTNSLSVTDRAELSSSTSSIGDAGNISITATDSVLVEGAGETEFELPSIINSDVEISVFSDTVGNSGNIDIITPNLTVTNGGIVSASTFSEGNAGNLTLRVSESLEVSNDALIQAEVFEGATGNSGDLNIETANLTVDNGAQISASTRGNGSAGNLTISATDSINITGETETGPSALLATGLVEDGKSGELNISTKDLNIKDNGLVSVGNFPALEGRREPGTGEPGDLNIQANSINVESGGNITAATRSSVGDGANITLQVAENITLRDGGFISAEAFDEGNGGNLNIDTGFIVAFPGNNDIIANAQQGQGGNININAESVLGIAERPLSDSTNDINASSEVSGLEGGVDINTLDFNPLQGLIEIVTGIVKPEETTAQACRANREAAAKNGLNITGKGGILPAPDLPLDSQNILIEGKSNDSVSAIPKAIETSQGKLQPARGVKITKNGEIILTAYRTNNQGDRLLESKINCGT